MSTSLTASTSLEDVHLRSLQEERERSLVEKARSFRASLPTSKLEQAAEGVASGYSRPVITEVTEDLRNIAKCMKAGDASGAAEIWGGAAGEIKFRTQRSTMMPLWSLLSQDRTLSKVSYFDPALDVVSICTQLIISSTVRHLDTGVVLARLLGACKDKMSTAIMLLFIARFQSKKAAAKIQERAARKGVALPSQVRAALGAQATADVLLNQIRHRLSEDSDENKFTIVDPRNPERDRLVTMSKKNSPEPEDWQVLELAQERSRELATVALLVLGLFMKHSGMVELWREPLPPKFIRGTNAVKRPICVRLTDSARDSIEDRVSTWVNSAWIINPMWCPPPDGQYLTSNKNAKISGMDGLRRLLVDSEGQYLGTTAEGTVQWDEAVKAMSHTPIQSPEKLLPKLRYLKTTLDRERSFSGKNYLSVQDSMTLSVASHACHTDISCVYFPVSMDFRGRTYYLGTSWNPQGSDLSKALVRSGLENRSLPEDPLTYALMLSSWRGIHGGPNEKAPLPFSPFQVPSVGGGPGPWVDLTVSEILRDRDGSRSEKPYQAGVFSPDDSRQLYQIDGTCNGLQHLSALALDRTAGKAVNLCRSVPDSEGPEDIYREVAERLEQALRSRGDNWARRLLAGGVAFTRSLTKRQVMVIPYGGTLPAIQEYTLRAVSDQAGTLSSSLWRKVEITPGEPDKVAREQNYQAFEDRELTDHPLFRKDCEKLGNLMFKIIKEEAIPKASAIMAVLVKFAKTAKDRAISWRVRNDERSLWVVQATAIRKKMSSRLPGVHLPDAVQRLTMYTLEKDDDNNVVNANRIDKAYNATAIVPNFVHSHDADHMLKVGSRMAEGGHPFVSVHDCYFTDRQGLKDLYTHTREAFVEKYTRGTGEHPFEQPVKFITTPDSDPSLEDKEWDSWYDAVEEMLGSEDRATLEEAGDLDITEVLDSYWFFC